MAENIPRSSLALIERPHSYLLQARPNLPGKLAYPGKLHFFGGRVNLNEHPYEALKRELLQEELEISGSWNISDDLPEPLWEGHYTGEDKYGSAVLRHITLYGLEMPEYAGGPTVTDGGDICLVTKDVEAIMTLESEMAPFAFEALTSYARTGHVLIS